MSEEGCRPKKGGLRVLKTRKRNPEGSFHQKWQDGQKTKGKLLGGPREVKKNKTFCAAFSRDVAKKTKINWGTNSFKKPAWVWEEEGFCGILYGTEVRPSGVGPNDGDRSTKRGEIGDLKLVSQAFRESAREGS